MKFRNCPAHFLRKVEIPTLSKSIPTLRTEFISSLLPCTILELPGTILESADKVGIPTLRRCNSGIAPIPTLRRTYIMIFCKLINVGDKY